ncbi:hypothetical protein [Geomesophilobacter sediminis]|uniref:Uncharacterized protein n=1 Tax=Geomesophilobacter sediminis TaxID=2798584 RepID=A0A8J7LXW9_9BACT|nr:hypothetical protein [Geomesophilobacter sediminis]MBJ6723841.1 hypothetical protein [Geomesophilobacter sediminis]
MKKVRLSLPEISLIAATRVVLGGGIALLYADRFTNRKRKALGWALFLAGAASTIPLGRLVMDRKEGAEPALEDKEQKCECETEPAAKAPRFAWRKRI